MNTDLQDSERRLKVLKHFRDSEGYTSRAQAQNEVGMNFYTTKRIFKDLNTVGLIRQEIIGNKVMWCLTDKGKVILKENKPKEKQ